jgi:hypothetical protein
MAVVTRPHFFNCRPVDFSGENLMATAVLDEEQP